MASMKNSTAVLKAQDTQYHFHPFMNHKQLHADGGARIITEAQGCWLQDSDGARILDGMAGLWNVNLGYGRTELAQAAFDQMQELPYYNAFFNTSTPPSIELARVLIEDLAPDMSMAMFSSSGSEANDTNLRLARHYWTLEGKPEKRAIISRQKAYHGSTVAASALGGMSAMHAQGVGIDDIHHVMAPYYFGLSNDGESPDEFGLRAAKSIEDKILELGPENVAAFIGEPIQGAGGLIFPPDSYWPEVQRICRQYDLLLIVDEVICGFGRLGTWFGSQHYDLKPDLMTLAKAITSGYQPLSANLLGPRITECFLSHDEEFVHGYTNAGHPVACAVALENLRLLREERVVETVRDDIGPYFQAKLYDALHDHPLIGEVRGHGMLAALELVENKLTRGRFDADKNVGMLCRENSFAENLMMRAVGDTMILSPVLTMTREEIDELVARAEKAVDATAKALGVS